MGAGQSTSRPESDLIANMTSNDIIDASDAINKDPIKDTFANKRFAGNKKKKGRNKSNTTTSSIRRLLALTILLFIMFLLAVGLYRWRQKST